MKNKVLQSVIGATVTAAIAWALVSYVIQGEVNWGSLLAFVVPFAVVFGFLTWKRATRETG